MLGDVLRAERIARHQDGLTKIVGRGVDMGSRIIHNRISFQNSAVLYFAVLADVADPALVAHGKITVIAAEQELAPSVTMQPSLSSRALTVALAPQSQMALISVMVSATSNSLRLPVKQLALEIRAQAEHSTGMFSTSTMSRS